MTHGKTNSFKALTLMVALLSLTIGFTPASFAELVTSETIIQELDTQADTAVIQQVLANEQVQARLLELGFTPDEVQQRLSRLNPEQRHALANQIQEAQTAAGPILGAALVNLIVYVIVPLIAACLLYLVSGDKS